MSKWQRSLSVVSVALFSLAVAVALPRVHDTVQASDAGPTKGIVPDDAFAPGDGHIIGERLPDFIAVTTRDATGIAGYVSKDVMFPSEATFDGEDETMTVYAEDLHTVVGHMYPGRGFIALGEDPESVPMARMVCSDDGMTVVEC